MCSRIETAILTVFAFCSCTVLEDRTGCPCYLSLDLTDTRNNMCDSLFVRVFSDNGFDYSTMVKRADYQKGLCIKIPDRYGVDINVLDGSVPERFRKQPGLQIPQGDQCPEAYMHSIFCDTGSDNVVDSVAVSKNYCGVSMNFVSHDLSYYRVRVIGNINGYSRSGEPVEGEFEFTPFDEDDYKCFFRIPRQIDNSLRLGITALPGGKENYFAIGNYISSSGYDWNAADLDDIVITIDYTSTSISISIDDWSTEEYFKIVI